MQLLLLDPGGAGIRISSRTLLSSQTASRTVRLFEAMIIMLQLKETAQFGPLTSEEYSRILARILLAERSFGGLVRDASVERVCNEISARGGKLWEGTGNCFANALSLKA